MTHTPVFNITRTQKGRVTIIARELLRNDALSTLRNFKARARDMHSNVFFNMVEVPYELTEAGKREASIKQQLREIEKAAAAKDAARITAGHNLDRGWCDICLCYPPGALVCERCDSTDLTDDGTCIACAESGRDREVA